ncbi:MAG TPA: hypothetical protein VF215_01115 [Thermoanaerobaculia bacterium]
MRVIFAVLAGLLFYGCSHRPALEGCLPTSEIVMRAEKIATLDWQHSTEEDVARAWPGSFDGGSHNSGYRCEPCTGSAEYAEERRIVAGEHICSMLLFFIEESSADGCTSQLDLFVVQQTVSTRDAAWVLVEELLRPFAGFNKVAVNRGTPVPAEEDFSWQDTPAPGLTTSVDYKIQRVASGFHVWVRIGRDTSSLP